jgi:raffinose/stachyose/melibiose transport system permease protein
MTVSKSRLIRTGVTALLILAAVVYLSPFFVAFMNSLKTESEYLQSVLSMPERLQWNNYVEAFVAMDFLPAFMNSLVITVFGVLGFLLIGSMIAWKLARTPSVLSGVILVLLLSVMVVPGESIIIPQLVIARRLGLANARVGIIIMYWALLTPITTFLVHGFVKTIPYSLEESVRMDGANGFQTYFYIVLPLLKPILSVGAIFFGLIVWNDFLLPLIILQKPHLYTIPLAALRFFTQYSAEYTQWMASVFLASLPMIVLFLVAQKRIMSGVMKGAVKF